MCLYVNVWLHMYTNITHMCVFVRVFADILSFRANAVNVDIPIELNVKVYAIRLIRLA